MKAAAVTLKPKWLETSVENCFMHLFMWLYRLILWENRNLSHRIWLKK